MMSVVNFDDWSAKYVTFRPIVSAYRDDPYR
jgi:hypothetical protein